MLEAKTTTCRRCKVALVEVGDHICVECDQEIERLIQERDARDKADAYQRRLEEARLPRGPRQSAWSLEGFTLHSSEAEDAVFAIRQWAAKSHPEKPILFITGPSGSGKSHLAVGGLKHWIRKHERGGLFIVAPDFMMQLRSSSDQASFLDQAKMAPCLVIDEMGLENISDFTTMIWHSILSYRGPDQECLPTIITSNLDLPQLAARWTLRKEDEDEGAPAELRSQRVTRRIADYGEWLELTEVYRP